jgi:hypothetical protein
MDDHAVFISTEGEVAVPGHRPAVAATGNWSASITKASDRPAVLPEVWRRPSIVDAGRVMPLSVRWSRRALRRRRHCRTDSATRCGRVVLYGASFGWEMELFPGQNMLLVNIPWRQVFSSSSS